MTLKEWNPAFSTLLYHFAIVSLAASLMVFLAKIILSEWQSEYAFCKSGYSSKRISDLFFCLSVHLSADLKRVCQNRHILLFVFLQARRGKILSMPLF